MAEEYTTINKRFRLICEALYGGNVTGMAKATFIRRTTLNSIMGENETAPGFEVIAKIAEISSPIISMEWLIRGTGEMFVEASGTAVCMDGQQNLVGSNNNNTGNNTGVTETFVRGLLDEKDKQIDRLLGIIEKLSK